MEGKCASDAASKTGRGADSELDGIAARETDAARSDLLRDAKLIEAKFPDLLESMPDSIVVSNSSGHIVLANSHAERLFGYGRGELRATHIETLLPERYRHLHLEHRCRFFSQPRVRAMGAGLELYGLRKDGSEFPVEVSLSPLTEESDPLVMSAIRDTTARKRAERMFRDLLEAAPDAITIVDRAGRIVLVNSQTELLFGYPRTELLGQPVEKLMPVRYQNKHQTHRNAFFADPKVRPMGVGLELFGRHKDGREFSVEISLSPLETEDGTLVTSAIRDITERKHFENALKEKNIELERANQAKDRFLATMSHELRTPLNAVIGFTGTLLMKLPGALNADQERQLKTIQSNAKHLLSLINDLLDLAKVESGTLELYLEPTMCAEVIDAAVASLRPLAEDRDLAVEVVALDDNLALTVDRRAFRQIVLNLINNAIKFTEEGRVRITYGRVWREGRFNVEISVSDTGVGISAEDQQRLFTAFSQVATRRHAQEGTGLGLYLSQRLADALGGRILVHSELGAGSTFTLVLPDL